MNHEQFVLPTLEVDKRHLKEVVQCLLHTILFHREIGLCSPKEVDCDFFDITYVKIEHGRVDEGVDNTATRLAADVERSGKGTAELSLSFLKKVMKPGLLRATEESVVWERWVLRFVVVDTRRVPDAERARQHAERQAALRNRILRISQAANEKRDHIPRVTDDAPLPYAFEISMEMGQKKQEGSLDLGFVTSIFNKIALG